MDISVRAADALAVETPLLALGMFAGEPLPAAIAPLIEAADWAGKPKQTLLLYPRGAVAATRVLLLGLGKRANSSAERLREAGAIAVQHARELGVAALALAIPAIDSIGGAQIGQALAEGAQLGQYRFDTFRTGLSAEQTRVVDALTIIAAGDAEAYDQGVKVGVAIAEGTKLARDLVNRPPNDVTPTVLGETAQAMGQTFGFNVTVLDRAALEAGGFGGIIGVGKGSAQEPRFIVMEHGQKREGVPTVCLVGKGITFDTGGISIKPAERMDEMKSDMGGAAAVFGTMHVVGALKLPLHVVGLISAAENMPSSTAYKPGDILKTLSGKTIEVLNTDAEGRIVLADALFYAQRFAPNAIVDLATLTGAIVVALGTHATGMMTNSDDVAARLTGAGEATSERVWRMPLWDVYTEQIRSDVADIKNTGGRQGGALTAAAFLAEFVGGYPWAHLDIAGTAYSDRATRPYTPKGATGVGVRLLTHMLINWNAGS